MAIKKPKRSRPKTASLSATTIEQIRREATPILRGFVALNNEASTAAQKVIHNLVIEKSKHPPTLKDKVLFWLSYSLSLKCLPGYATLDYEHIRQINSLLTTIQHYIEDGSQRRPLNLLMLASPGAGKSHFIKCIATSLRGQNISAITFNMAGLQTNEDLIPPLDNARNLKVEDRIPLLFLDEFDSAPENIALLLPLLWDGEMNLGQRDLKLGKVIIVLAGSDPKLPATMDHAKSMRQGLSGSDSHNPKVVDLLSRINGGVFQIPSFYDRSHDLDRRPDKVCIAVQLLRQRFGETLKTVPLGLLTFIALTDFRYGVRSIAHLIDLIPYKKSASKLDINRLLPPLDNADNLKTSSLAYHILSEDQAHGVIQLWKESSAIDATLPAGPTDREFAYLGRVPGSDFFEYYIERLIRAFSSD